MSFQQSSFSGYMPSLDILIHGACGCLSFYCKYTRLLPLFSYGLFLWIFDEMHFCIPKTYCFFCYWKGQFVVIPHMPSALQCLLDACLDWQLSIMWLSLYSFLVYWYRHFSDTIHRFHYQLSWISLRLKSIHFFLSMTDVNLKKILLWLHHIL